jgi:toxin-antitoxin system PIN domain toxin
LNWLELAVNGRSGYGMSPQVLGSAVRILTSPRVFRQPYAPGEVIEYVTVLMEQPNCHRVLPGPRHWEIFRDLCRDTNATGDLVPDAWFAALAIEAEAEWITLDRGYQRFPGLRWRTPF